MARRFLIIDGYNLMHALGMARRRYGPGDLERRRSWFLRHVAGRLDEEQRSATTIVFDAGDPRIDGPREMVQSGMRVVFAPAGSDADTAIEEMIARHSSPKQLVVVSSDRRIRAAIGRRRGTSLRSEEFAAELDAVRGGTDTGTEPTDGLLDKKEGAALSPEETAAWLAEFGESC